MARSTRSLARQPGNCLTMPVSCNSGAPRGAAATGPPATVTMTAAIRSSPCEPSPAWPPRGLPGPLFILVAFDSVRNLVRLFQPFLEYAPGLVGLLMDERHGPAIDRLAELAVDVIVVEPDGGRIAAGVGVVDTIEPRPVDRAQAHRAGFAARIHLATLQAERAEPAAGCADCDHLRMRGRIAERRDLVVPLGDDIAGARDDGAERAAQAGAHLLG